VGLVASGCDFWLVGSCGSKIAGWWDELVAFRG
jgi:hypothetical protein